MSKSKSNHTKRIFIIAIGILFLAVAAVLIYMIYMLFVRSNLSSNPTDIAPDIEIVNIQNADDLKKAADKVRELQQSDIEVEELNAIESSML